MTYLDASKAPVEIFITNERTWEEFFRVTLPADLGPRKLKAALNTLAASGFRDSYDFSRKVIDPRSASLAKAQATSMAKRIETRTGIKMQILHGIHADGKA